MGSRSSTCEGCNFLSYCPIASELCPGVTNSRLVADGSLSCDIILPYYAPISAIMFFGIVVGIPALFYYLIHEHTKFLKQMPVPDVAEDTPPNADQKWQFRVHATKNSSKTLYNMFEYNW